MRHQNVNSIFRNDLSAIIILVLMLAGCSLASCSNEQPVVGSELTTGKPSLLRAIDNSVLSVIVRIDEGGFEFIGEQRPDGNWFVQMNLPANMTYSYVASWYARVEQQRILLVEQRGQFFTDPAMSDSPPPATDDVSVGNGFDADCDGMWNLAEMKAESDPLSSPGCSESEVTSAGTAANADGISSPPVSATLPVMQPISEGCFSMGSPETDVFRQDDERQHTVCVEAFEIGRFEVTFDQYNEFASQPGTLQSIPNDRSWGMGSRPVINVVWRDAVAYTQWLSELTGDTYRLPTEAEWEYAARGGTDTLFWTGDTLRDDQEHFGSADPYGGGVATGMPFRDKTIPVGSLQPNPFGLYDMLGNVIEFTCSLYSNNYENMLEEQCDYDMTQEHVVRGAAYSYIATWARSSTRTGMVFPDEANGHVGFRVVRENP